MGNRRFHWGGSRGGFRCRGNNVWLVTETETPGGGTLVTGGPGGGGVLVTGEVGLSPEVGETRGRGRVGLAGGREVSSLSLSLASSLSGEAVREMLREEVRILSWLVWGREGAAAVHLAPVGPKWPRQGRWHLVQERGAEGAAGEGSTACPGRAACPAAAGAAVVVACPSAVGEAGVACSAGVLAACSTALGREAAEAAACSAAFF